MKLLGVFFTVLAILVLFGTLWTLDKPRAMIVNIAAGITLLVVGVGMIWGGRRLGTKPPKEDDSRES